MMKPPLTGCLSFIAAKDLQDGCWANALKALNPTVNLRS